MKIVLNKRSLLRRLLLMLLCEIVVAIAYFEVGHRYNFGHFVPYGLHVDVLSEEVSIGIPGQKKIYKAELSNFSFWPVRPEMCRSAPLRAPVFGIAKYTVLTNIRKGHHRFPRPFARDDARAP